MIGFLQGGGRRIFSYKFDAFFVFMVRLDDDADTGGMPKLQGYAAGVVKLDADEAFLQPCDLWQEACCQDISRRKVSLEISEIYIRDREYTLLSAL